MAEVPAAKLAYRFDPDVDPPGSAAIKDDPNQKLETIQKDFDNRRKDDALIRTVVSPDGQRALALYETGENQPGEFRVDLYGTDGNFLRNVTAPDFAGAFAPMAAWSPDGSHVIFAGRKTLTPKPSPTPEVPLPVDPSATPIPQPTVAPVFAPLPLFNSEQLYICDRDGFGLKPLTTREGLIYFSFSWAPDGHAITALACKEDEWEAREKEHRSPYGRPRLIELDSRERLLDDDLTEASPVWSTDSTKVATAFDTNVRIYDARGDAATQAQVELRDALLNASATYDKIKLAASAKKVSSSNPTSEPTAPAGTPVSFNPVVRLEWPDDKDIYLQTAYVRIYGSEPVNTFPRWHVLHLSPQAEILGAQQATK
jgi:hypothetical protein